MIKRSLPIIESLWLKRYYCAVEPILSRTRFYLPMPFLSNEHFEFSELGPCLEFSDGELKQGEELLRAMGIGVDDWFVCVHGRDAMHLANKYNLGSVEDLELGVRDVTIENYFDAMKWVADQGGYVIRMGQDALGPLPNLHPRIIDYTTDYRSELGDVFLPAKCRFFFGSASGMHSPAYMYNVPISGANWAPYRDVTMGKRSLFIPKFLKDLKEGRILTFPEIATRGLFDPKPGIRYPKSVPGWERELGLTWVENSPGDILDLAKDMMDMVEGRPSPEGGSVLQKRYLEFYKGVNNHPLAGKIGPRFALKHKDLFTRKDQ